MKIKNILFLSIILLMCLTTISMAHSGRTDSNGGHKDNKNKSGLGSYHYHCGGNPPHLHTNGCEYTKAPEKKSTTKAPVTKSTTKIPEVKKEVTSKEISAEKISIPNKVSSIKLNERKNIKVNITPSDTTNKNLKWTTSDDKIIDIDSNGNIKPKKDGIATITVTSDNGKTDSMVITVGTGIQEHRETIKNDFNNNQAINNNETNNKEDTKESNAVVGFICGIALKASGYVGYNRYKKRKV